MCGAPAVDAERMTLTALPAAPAPPRIPRWTKVTLVVLAAVLVPCGAVVMWLVISLTGGFDDFVDRYEPLPDDPHVVEAREHGEAHVAAELDGVVPAASAALGGGSRLGQAAGDECVTGQHNWKIDNDYDLYCTHGSGVVLQGDLDRFREHALALHATLEQDGWVAGTGGTGGIAGVVGEYWDARAALADPGYSPADLPVADYVRGDSLLLVQWVEPGEHSSAAYPLGPVAWQPTGGGRPVEAGLLVPPGSYGTALVVSTEYFRD